MGFPQDYSETRAFQAEVSTKLFGNLSHSLCWKALTQPLSEGYNIHNLAFGSELYICVALHIIQHCPRLWHKCKEHALNKII